MKNLKKTLLSFGVALSLVAGQQGSAVKLSSLCLFNDGDGQVDVLFVKPKPVVTTPTEIMAGRLSPAELRIIHKNMKSHSELECPYGLALESEELIKEVMAMIFELEGSEKLGLNVTMSRLVKYAEDKNFEGIVMMHKTLTQEIKKQFLS